MKHMMVNKVGPLYEPSTVPTYTAVFAYVLRTYTPEATREYMADRLYDAGQVDTDFDMAAVVAYDLSNQVYAFYRDWATAEATWDQVQASIEALLPDAHWSPTPSVLGEAGEVM